MCACVRVRARVLSFGFRGFRDYGLGDAKTDDIAVLCMPGVQPTSGCSIQGFGGIKCF